MFDVQELQPNEPTTEKEITSNPVAGPSRDPSPLTKKKKTDVEAKGTKTAKANVKTKPTKTTKANVEAKATKTKKATESPYKFSSKKTYRLI